MIKLIAFDVDGTLTDGSLILGPEGEAYKKFNAKDGLGLSLAHRMGYIVGFITGRKSPFAEQRARELSLDFILDGIDNKVSALDRLLKQNGISWEETAYMGDDLNDLPVLLRVGLPAVPKDACGDCLGAARFISPCCGGEGAARSLIERIIKGEGRWKEALSHYLDQQEKNFQ